MSYTPVSGTFRLTDYGAIPNDVTKEVGPAWDSAMTAIVAAGGGVLDLGVDVYYTSRALVVGSNGEYAQLPLPFVATSAPKVPIVIRGSMAGTINYYNSGAIPVQPIRGGIVSLLTGQAYSGTSFVPSVIGARAANPGITISYVSFTNLFVKFENVVVRTPNNPTLTAVDTFSVLQVETNGLTIDTPASYSGTLTVPTNPQAFGLILPTINNNAISKVRRTIICGYYGNLAFNEHADADSLLLLNGRVALVPFGPSAYRPGTFAQVVAENHQYVISYVAPGSGVAASLPGIFPISITDINVEDAGGPYIAFASIEHLHGVADKLTGEIGYSRVLGGTGTVSGLTGAVGTKLSLTDYTTGIRTGPISATTVALNASTSDTFTRADSATTLGTPERSVVGTPAYAGTGTWGIRGNRAYIATALGGAPTYYAFFVETNKADCIVNLDVVVTTGALDVNGNPRTDAGICARASDANNFIFLEFITGSLVNGGNVVLYKRVAGAFTQLGSGLTGRITQGSTHNLKLVMSGNTYTVYYDGVVSFTYTGTTGLEANTKHFASIGLSQSGGTGNDDGGTNFDNFTVS